MGFRHPALLVRDRLLAGNATVRSAGTSADAPAPGSAALHPGYARPPGPAADPWPA